MAVFSVYYPPNQKISSKADGFRLVPDAKAPWALVFPPFWLISKGLWLELLAWLVAFIAILMLGFWQPNPLIGYLSAIPGFYLLLEGHELVARKLERNGWWFGGIVEADDVTEAEYRVVHELGMAVEPENQKVTLVSQTARAKSSLMHLPKTTNPAGLFPE